VIPADRVLLTGGSGLLGRALLSLAPALPSPPRAELDVADERSVAAALDRYRPQVVLHAAAMTRFDEARKDRAGAVRANIIGTANVAVAALERGLRLVYISTDYVYPGTPGPHREDEPLLPVNEYTWTKLGGECAVRLVPDSLIIRTTFGPRPCPYERAAMDKVTSKLYVDELAPHVLDLARGALTGIVNVGSEPRSLFDYARETRPDVVSVKLSELAESIPVDTSLDLTRWKACRAG
jgi:dTDP-4-dehydrorhamnose reductase